MPNRVPNAEGDDDDAIFVKNRVPIKFCFHRSVTQGRGQITRDVERHGGKIVLNERDANVLLVDEQEDINFLRRRYYSSTELYRLSLYVEPRGFVQACIRAGEYRHLEPVKQGMPGRAPGANGVPRVRVPFTEEDRDHLAYYLSTRFPTRDGRMGVAAYKDLERLGQTEDQSWAWARRHTYHSWREHYKMNPMMMDARIDFYLQRLKGIGHHFGHDPRRHDFRHLRQEEEENDEEEEEEEEEEEQWRGIQRQDRGRQEQVRPAAAAATGRRPDQAARNYLAHHERDLVRLDEQEEEDDAEVAIQELQRIKRHRVPPETQRLRETQAKRARISGSSNETRSSDVEVDDNEGPEKDNNNEESQEIQGSDLFGDSTYQDLDLNYDGPQDIEYPMPFSPRASPIPQQNRPPPSTQATLIASPQAAEKEAAPASTHRPMTMTQAEASPLRPVAPPSSQQTMVLTQERVAAQRARARGASAQPGPSKPRKTKTRSDAITVDPPYRNTRARSRSVEPQPQQSKLPPQGKERRDKGKRKEVLASIREDTNTREEKREDAEEDLPLHSVTGELSTRGTFEDEMVVEGLLEASPENEVDEDDGISDGGDIAHQLPRFQDVDIGGHPSDSDDAEIHESLVRAAAQEGSAGKRERDVPEGGEPESDDQDQDDDDDADRIQRMANESLHVGLAPTPPQPRVTRSRAAVTQTQTQTRPGISPRRTRSGSQARAAPPPATFPSPGTKAGAVVNRFQEEERKVPYAPPQGTRAAKAVRGKTKRG